MRVEFERLQKSLEETRNIAIMRPTEANVRRYMELEAQVVSRASTFADVAQRIAWASPELDPTLQGRPVNAKALEVFDQLQTAQRSQSISAGRSGLARMSPRVSWRCCRWPPVGGCWWRAMALTMSPGRAAAGR